MDDDPIDLGLKILVLTIVLLIFTLHRINCSYTD